MTRKAEPGWLIPDWPAPATVRAVSTTRAGGVSTGSHSGLNLADHVEDDARAVLENRDRLRRALGLEREPAWLRQVHGTSVVKADGLDAPVVADAAWAGEPGTVCAVMTADCLPLLLCDPGGTRVGAVHAGWRGLAAGVIEAAVERLGKARELLAWMGPAIGPENFVVGEEVRQAFLAQSPAAESAFLRDADRWRADIYELARQRLAACGVQRVYGGGLCTYADRERFYSYRRDGVTGRMATLIWLTS